MPDLSNFHTELCGGAASTYFVLEIFQNKPSVIYYLSFPVRHKVGNVDNFVLPKFANK